ncbi:MAG TPA: 50S ribosomal protein L3 [Patescibacteria group bacterium]|nr:50S ribosomal protein L3 [Patescibacteria group bacterium]
MNISSLVGTKINQTQGFLEDGRRVPLSIISVGGNVVTQVKTQDHEGYNALQLGFGNTKRSNKPTTGHIKKAGIDTTPRFFREIRVDDTESAAVGTTLNIAEVFEAGDIVDVMGTSKGKGFAGVVKKWNFAGGPRTHGQSDRERARGSSGSGTTPGRVYKGKKMAGRMGDNQVTVKNLEVLAIDGDTILVRGLIPGIKGSTVVVTKVGKNKKYIPLFSEKKEEAPVEVVEVAEMPAEVAAVDAPVETKEEVKTEEVVEAPPAEEVKTEDVSSENSEKSEDQSAEAEKSEEVKDEEEVKSS